jgi:hypothetical protein
MLGSFYFMDGSSFLVDQKHVQERTWMMVFCLQIFLCYSLDDNVPPIKVLLGQTSAMKVP